MLSIHFEKLHFFAFHGLYPLEKTGGNEFEFNLSLFFEKRNAIVRHISETINYAAVYQLIKEEMSEPRELLETFLMELSEKLKKRFPEIISLKMSIYKLTVSLENFEGRIGVQYEKSF